MKKFKKLMALMFIFIFSAALFAGCGSSSNSSNSGQSKSSSDSSLDNIKKAGVIKIGLEDSFPPMEFRNNKNELKGFDIDMANAIGKKLGVKTEFVPTDFNGIILALKTGKFDAIISGLSITDERKKEIAFSEPYLMDSQIIIVKNGNTAIKKADDLKGKTVGVGLGTTSENVAAKMKGLKEVKKYDKTTEELQDLLIGRIDAVVVDEPVGRYYLSASDKKGKYLVLNDNLTKEPMGIGFKKENKDLQSAVQKAVNELKKEGELSKLSIKWFGTDIYK
ncbi:amino acid ABC transporter substrate-binding protein [Clostridium fermenticellae]|uniref:Amino acid ABC transporter substrate-binding protein n=1 Tax=Clostridium fermenticellae TaxID=2068654 RepID=A0A386H5V0_9CLOT|nr:ABC transporter substrate-binding protein [Clostridium fermenticellae]AYD41089.1 amino acid ABC transporter substrate-binding protein [Clostridium fermenticellae]